MNKLKIVRYVDGRGEELKVDVSVNGRLVHGASEFGFSETVNGQSRWITLTFPVEEAIKAQVSGDVKEVLGKRVIIYPDDGHLVAECLDLPGYISEGGTEAEVLAKIEEEIRANAPFLVVPRSMVWPTIAVESGKTEE